MAHHNRGRVEGTEIKAIGETTKQTVGRHKPSAKQQQEQQSLVSRRSTTSGLSLPGKGPMTKGGPAVTAQEEEQPKTQPKSPLPVVQTTTEPVNLEVEFNNLISGFPQTPLPAILVGEPNLDISNEKAPQETTKDEEEEKDEEMEQEEEQQVKKAAPVREKRVEPPSLSKTRSSPKRKVQEESSEEEGEEEQEEESQDKSEGFEDQESSSTTTGSQKKNNNKKQKTTGTEEEEMKVVKKGKKGTGKARKRQVKKSPHMVSIEGIIFGENREIKVVRVPGHIDESARKVENPDKWVGWYCLIREHVIAAFNTLSETERNNILVDTDKTKVGLRVMIRTPRGPTDSGHDIYRPDFTKPILDKDGTHKVDEHGITMYEPMLHWGKFTAFDLAMIIGDTFLMTYEATNRYNICATNVGSDLGSVWINEIRIDTRRWIVTVNQKLVYPASQDSLEKKRKREEDKAKGLIVEKKKKGGKKTNHTNETPTKTVKKSNNTEDTRTTKKARTTH